MNQSQPKVAIVILANAESLEGMGRVANALVLAKELKESGATSRVIFDGAGSQWIGVLSNTEHPLHGLFGAVRDRITGACGYCTHAFRQDAQVSAAEVSLLDEFDGHPSIAKLVREGFQIVTY